MSKPARHLRVSILTCLLAAWPLYAGAQPPAAAQERLAVSRTLPADPSQDPLHRWFAEQDKILDDILARLARIETLVADIHRLVSSLPSQPPRAAASIPDVATRGEPAQPAATPPPAAMQAAPAPAAPPAASQPTQAPEPAPAVKPVPAAQMDDEDEGFVLVDWLPQLAGGGLLILLLLLWSRRRASASKPAASKSSAQAAKAPARAAPATPSVQEAPPRAAKSEMPKAAAAPAQPFPVDTASVDIDLGVDTDQSDQALELADIMLSMGLGQGAAQTLTEQIRNEPKQALRHWLKLLEVYRRNGQQAEFERSAEELRQHFNVKPEDWHAHPGSQHSIEDYPHIATRLTELWGKPACLVYLKNLLADNRGGARSGFPQAVAEELLLLTAILRSEGFLS